MSADSTKTPPPGFDDLPIAEQIAYVQALWDRIAATAESVPVPEWHLEIVAERARDDHPADSEPWSEARERIRKKLEDRRE